MHLLMASALGLACAVPGVPLAVHTTVHGMGRLIAIHLFLLHSSLLQLQSKDIQHITTIGYIIQI